VVQLGSLRWVDDVASVGQAFEAPATGEPPIVRAAEQPHPLDLGLPALHPRLDVVALMPTSA
jgi:hypothetical protein